MLVIAPRGGGTRRYCYGGSGIFDTISRKMMASGFKKAISSGAKSAIAQKVADAVVNGATSATQKAVEGAVKEAINTVKPYVKDSLQKLVSRKGPHNTSTTTTTTITPPPSSGYNVKKSKININSLIDGSGIVLD